MDDTPCNPNTVKQALTTTINSNFNDLHKPLNLQQAIAESNRCLYCYDAPCIQACPTSIDIPTFIHQISSDNINGAAKTILSENIMGGTCARVCPTEILCKESCVLNTSIEQPVEIGLLQRHAVDNFMVTVRAHPFKRNKILPHNIAIVGAGPAGLSCAHRLSMLGHNITIYEAKDKSGGLNEYGLAAYKMTNDFAQKEIEFILEIGAITIKNNQLLGDNISLQQLQEKYEAVFVGIGLDKTYKLGLDKECAEGIYDAVDFIETLRTTKDKSQVKVGNNVVVIGAGNTAIDAAIQAKKLGAQNVTLVYRRGEQHMSATAYEIELARKNGVNIKTWLTPTAILADEHIAQIQCAKTDLKEGELIETLFTETIECDMLLKAIGQSLNTDNLNDLQIEKGKIVVNDNYQTSQLNIFAGGDAIQSGEDLTVQAVEDGKQAAHSIDVFLTEKK